MATRTVKVYGRGYGATPANITATLNGNTVFTGDVPTLNTPIPPLPDTSLTGVTVPLFSFEIDTAFVGQIPMTCTVNSGTVIFAEILANYTSVINPAITEAQLAVLQDRNSTPAQRMAVCELIANPPFSAAEKSTYLDPATTWPERNTIVTVERCPTTVSGASYFGFIDDTDPRSNVQINGVAQNPNTGDLPGVWWWTVGQGSVLAYNLDVDAAKI